ncbi:sodium-dependent proline transporter isoform 4-T4 [Sarcophilus harrisii]
MKRRQASHLGEPVTPDLLMTPSDQGDGDLEIDFTADRGNWTGKLDFLLSCIGYCVGLGNVWRFPYRAYTNGGGAFLVPYFIMLTICGIPLFFLELSLGQFSSLGPLAVWKISPLFKADMFSTSKGVQASEIQVVYFTATFPYLILLMLLIRGLTLQGAWRGIQFYLTPQFDHLLTSKVWIEAALQIFYSLGVGFGGLLTFASYNTFHQNIYRDTFIVTLGNAITSILAGFAIFSVLGYMSQELGVPVDQVAKAGPGLAFVVYPQAMTMLPLSPFWSFLFFFMLLTLGLDSQFAFLETIVTALTDEFPYYLRPKKAIFSGTICVAMFLMGLILTTDGGMYWLVLLDDYSAGFGLMVVVITTCLTVTRVYGIQRFCRDIHMMLGFKPGLYFKACWMFLSPATLMALLVYSIVKYQPSEYGTYRFPYWAELLGILMGLLSCIVIPACMLTAVLREEGTLWERIQQASRPAMDWGPSLEENRTGMYVATLAGSQSPKPLMVHMRKYGGVTSFENTAIEVDREIEEEESMM